MSSLLRFNSQEARNSHRRLQGTFLAQGIFGHVRKASRYVLAIYFNSEDVVWTCSKGQHVSSLLCFNSEDVHKWVPTAAGKACMFARRAGMSSLSISTARPFGHARKASMYPRCCFSSEDVQKWVPTAAGKACSQGEQVCPRYLFQQRNVVWTCSQGQHVSSLLCFNSEDVQRRLQGI